MKKSRNPKHHRLGLFLRNRRKLLRMTLEDLSAKCNVTKSFLSRVENGFMGVSFVNTIQLSNALNFSLDDLKTYLAITPPCTCPFCSISVPSVPSVVNPNF